MCSLGKGWAVASVCVWSIHRNSILCVHGCGVMEPGERPAEVCLSRQPEPTLSTLGSQPLSLENYEILDFCHVRHRVCGVCYSTSKRTHPSQKEKPMWTGR